MILTILTILISIGYSALNQNLSVSGEAFLRSKGNVRISRIEMSNAENDGYETYNPEYSKKGTKTYSTLSNKNSTITYTVQITNTTGAKYTVYSMEISNTNSNVSCTPNITKGSIIEKGISDFTIDVKYNGTDSLTESIEDVCEIKYEFIPLDTTSPVLTAEIISQENKTAKLKITTTDEDGGSGLSPDNIYKYCLSTSGEEAKECTWTNYISGEEFEVTASSNGEYYLLVYSIGDKAGNISDEKENIGEIVNKLYVPLFNKVQDFTYTGSEQTYIVPADGYYKIEAWGAQGGNVVTYSGGKGAYTSGYIYLNKNEKLYVYVGSHPEDLQTAGGYNGGGSITSGQQGYGNGGGGATDIRLTGGEWDNDTGLNSRIMVAAGGGSGNKRGEGYGEGAGGAGGTIYGGNGYSFNATNGYGYGKSQGGTQTSGGIYSFTTENGGTYVSGSFGKGGGTETVTIELSQSGGGGGYYGGSHCGHGGAAGGSSFISGYAGVNAITSVSDRTHTNNTLHYSGKYFIDSNMEEDTNEGNGKAKITYISKEKPERKNKKLNGVRYIQDCTNGNSINIGSHWVELQAIYQGKNVAKGKTITAVSNVGTSNGTGTITSIVDGDIDSSQYSDFFWESRQCITVDLGQTYDLDEITTWHYWIDNRTYYEHTMFVSSDNVNWTSVTQPTKEESNNGYRINAYESESNVNLYAINNLITNSGFENGTTGITLFTENSISTDLKYSGAYSLYASTKYRWSGSSMSVDSSKIAIDDSIYISEQVYIRQLSSDTQFMYMPFANGQGTDYISATKTYANNKWEKISNIGKPTSTNNNGTYVVYGNMFASDNATSELDNIAYIDNLTLYNLTTIFSNGNEPNKEWCDTNIPYVSGTNVLLYLPRHSDYYTGIVNANGGYRVNDGTYNLTMINAKNGDTQVITERRRNGYTLNGYTLTNVLTASTTDLGGASITFDPSTKQALYTQGTESLYVTANWSINNYTLTINPNGGVLNGTTNNSTYNITYGSTENILNPTRTGYVFAGWTVSGQGSSMSGTTFTMGYENATLTANWASSKPTYTYTGSSQLIDDGNGNWRIKFLTSGTLTFTNLGTGVNGIDVFLVGGGGGGRTGSQRVNGAGGGGGGYTTTKKGHTISAGSSYNIVIGAGGATNSNGGTSSAFGFSAAGGKYGAPGASNFETEVAIGGNGGSGGGGGTSYQGYGGNGGSNGSNGSNGTGGNGGTGQGTTTREFGESDGTLYAGGGAGTEGKAGAGGGGVYNNTNNSDNYYVANGTANTGGGGGGGAFNFIKGGTGGSGIVVIRNTRVVPTEQMPSYTYTGSSRLEVDKNGNWKIKFLSSGTLTFTSLGDGTTAVDLFLVGGGGSGRYAGGGGGYTRTVKSLNIALNTSQQIVVGKGAAFSFTETINGGSSSALGYTAAGGYGVGQADKGGNGGSGGGGYAYSDSNSWAGSGGTNGKNGDASSSGCSGGYGQISVPGPNGETGNTREFGESTGDLYSGGGGGTAASGSAGLPGEVTTATNSGRGGGGVAGEDGIVIIRKHQ